MLEDGVTNSEKQTVVDPGQYLIVSTSVCLVSSPVAVAKAPVAPRARIAARTIPIVPGSLTAASLTQIVVNPGNARFISPPVSAYFGPGSWTETKTQAKLNHYLVDEVRVREQTGQTDTACIAPETLLTPGILR